MEHKLTENQKLDLAKALQIGWRKYTDLLGEPPHGTEKQLAALIELVPLSSIIQGISQRAISLWYAEGQS